MEMQARALGGPHAKADRVANIGRVFANDTAFVVLMFVISRALILTSFLAIAPHLAAPINGISPVAVENLRALGRRLVPHDRD